VNTENIEIGLVENFEEISFASCIVKGQTIVINIKEKLLPNEMVGDFAPIIAQKDGKITEIELISGTAVVKVGDYVTKGSVLIEPYTIDTSGNLMQVEAKAKIVAEVYNQESVEHYENSVEILRTGKVIEHSEVTLFGLSIYTLKPEMDFEFYETEVQDVNLIENIFLPFKMRKTTYYELEKRTISSNFEEVESEFIEKARTKTLENCKICDTIIDEFYTVRHLAGVDIVNYCIVTLEEIGVISC
ncbi:MAG: sporulation protein YqfD, partial [Clostridia bacterium]|nr:sporulation protein YqfD [Clostridia bacterium]